jgi:hypothetical protein
MLELTSFSNEYRDSLNFVTPAAQLCFERIDVNTMRRICLGAHKLLTRVRIQSGEPPFVFSDLVFFVYEWCTDADLRSWSGSRYVAWR